MLGVWPWQERARRWRDHAERERIWAAFDAAYSIARLAEGDIKKSVDLAYQSAVRIKYANAYDECAERWEQAAERQAQDGPGAPKLDAADAGRVAQGAPGEASGDDERGENGDRSGTKPPPP